MEDRHGETGAGLERPVRKHLRSSKRDRGSSSEDGWERSNSNVATFKLTGLGDLLDIREGNLDMVTEVLKTWRCAKFQVGISRALS